VRHLAAFVVAVATAIGCHHDPAPTAPATQPPPPPTAQPVPAVEPVAEPTPEQATPTVAGGDSTGIPECDALLATYTKYMSCDKVTAQPDMAKAMQDGLTQMRQGLAALKNAPPESKTEAVVGCKQAIEAIKSASSAMGCQP
jgi:hypothetical protein